MDQVLALRTAQTAALGRRLLGRNGFVADEPFWLPFGDGRGIYAFGADVAGDRDWWRLRRLYAETGLWPFLSGVPPLLLAAHIAGEPAPQPPPSLDAATARFASVLADGRAHFDKKPDATADMAAGDPAARKRLADILRRGQAPPGVDEQRRRHTDVGRAWLYLVSDVEGGLGIPAMLGLPSTPNWSGRVTGRQLGITDHAAAARVWNNAYGTEIFFVDRSLIGFKVARPPTDGDEIASVAVEHVAYCDGFDQNLGDVVDVAMTHVPADTWMFWWD